MEEVLKLVREERSNLEALIQEQGENGKIKEIQLLYNKQAKLYEVEAKIKEYNNIKN